MKNHLLLIFLTSLLVNIGYSQTTSIVAEKEPFEYLIGKVYSQISELGEFELKTKTSRIDPDGKAIFSSNLILGDKQIVTSERPISDQSYPNERFEILDVIVLDGLYTLCDGCIVSNRKNTTIKSIYRYGSTDTSSLLAAFARNTKTGKFKEVSNKELEKELEKNP